MCVYVYNRVRANIHYRILEALRVVYQVEIVDPNRLQNDNCLTQEPPGSLHESVRGNHGSDQISSRPLQKLHRAHVEPTRWRVELWSSRRASLRDARVVLEFAKEGFARFWSRKSLSWALYHLAERHREQHFKYAVKSVFTLSKVIYFWSSRFRWWDWPKWYNSRRMGGRFWNFWRLFALRTSKVWRVQHCRKSEQGTKSADWVERAVPSLQTRSS